MSLRTHPVVFRPNKVAIETAVRGSSSWVPGYLGIRVCRTVEHASLTTSKATWFVGVRTYAPAYLVPPFLMRLLR